MTFMIAATIAATALSGIPIDPTNVGAASYYDASYDHGGWAHIIQRRKGWGQLPEDFVPNERGYFCAHPDLPFGTRLHVMNAITGDEIVCQVVDRVAPADVPHWRSKWVIEMSYCAFVAAGGQAFNRFVVYPE